MMARSWRWSGLGIPIAFLLALTALAGAFGGGNAAQSDEPPHPIHIHAGTCAALGDVVEPLGDVTAVASGDLAGAPSAVPVKVSETEVDLELADILAAPHAINIHESAENIQNYIACGDVGGRVDDGELVIGLQESNGSDNVGVAVLREDGDETDVIVYLFEEGTSVGTEVEGAPEETTEPEEEATAEPEEEEQEAPAAQEVTVSIVDFAFDPATIEINAGDTVTWTNDGQAPHTVTADDRAFDSGRLDPGQSFSQTFDNPGSIPYHCDFHPNMTATVNVAEGGGAAPPAADEPEEEADEPPAATGREVAVSIVNFAFEPAEIQIGVGDTVVWTNNGQAPHTATGADREVLQSGTIAPGQSFSQTFSGAGTVEYFCEFHPNMLGTITIAEGGAPAAADQPAAAPAPKEVDATIVDFGFEPATIELNAGDSITWTNTGQAPHTVTADDRVFDSGRLDGGQSYTLTFEGAGTVTYHCDFHPNMTATIVVAEAAAAAPAPPAAAGDGEEVAVSIVNFAFEPAQLQIGVGDTVVWTNNGQAPHTATGNDRDALQSGTISPGQSFSQRFDTAGTIEYFCEFHPNMLGTITVGGSGAAPPAAADAPPAEAPAAQQLAADIVDFAFQPAALEVNTGDSVTWTHRGSAPHTVTADNRAVDSGRLDGGQSFTITFDAAGTFAYHCDFHPSMTGTVVVR